MIGGVEGPVDGAWGCRCLGQCEAFELGAEPCDLALELAGMKAVAGPGERTALCRAEHAGADRPLEGCRRGVMALDDLGADARLG